MNKTSLTARVRLVLFQAVGKGAARLKRMREVSPSADGDLRLCLKKPPPFEKGGRKLQAFLIKSKNSARMGGILPLTNN